MATWRDDLHPCSFRGVRCHYRQAAIKRERRLVVHEYPYRDNADIEELGRKNRTLHLELYLLDSDQPGTLYSRRDALLAALDEPGPGALVHPYHGELSVYAKEVRESYSTRSGGQVRFAVDFVEATNERAPSVATDTARVVRDRADALEGVSRDVFTELYDTTGMAASYIEDVASAVTQHLGDMERYSEHLARNIRDAIRSPFDLAGVLLDGVQHILDNARSIADVSLATPGLFGGDTRMAGPTGSSGARRAMSSYSRLFDAGDDALTVPDTTEQRRQQKRNQNACFDLIQRAAVAGAAKTSSVTDYTTSDAALGDRDTIIDGVDDQQRKSAPLGGPVDDTVYNALSDLADGVQDDLTTRGARLPALTTYTPRATLPMLVVAHRLYGDAARSDAMVRRNSIANPGFVPGGEALEVLDE